MKSKAGLSVQRLACFGLTTPNAERLAHFYEAAFDARRLAVEHLSDASLMANGACGATCIRLGLGRDMIELLEFDRPGEPYPKSALSSDLMFQHFAIAVTDMNAAYRRLLEVPGWTPISIGGPVQLPASSGGVAAFKFRDPDGHPLELLSHPSRQKEVPETTGSGLFTGIDHSAISVSDSSHSISFYQDLGFRILTRTLNRGPEQSQLDGLTESQVEVTGLAAAEPTPHIELLCYASAGTTPPSRVLRDNDVAATRLIFEVDGSVREDNTVQRFGLIDPDGHRLVLTSPLAGEMHSDRRVETSNSFVTLE